MFTTQSREARCFLVGLQTTNVAVPGSKRPINSGLFRGATQLGVLTQSLSRLALADYWAMNKASGSEPDLTSNGHNGTHQGGTVPLVALPNADQASDFNGSSQYVTIASNAAFSIPTTGNLTWEAWIRPDVLQFPNDSTGYVDWMGKCEEYSPTFEWEARMYSLTNSESRPNRLSAYAFNPDGNLGSGAFWQQASHNSALNVGTMARDAWFQGAIGKVAIYNFLLSQSQITNHYQAMTGKVPTGSCGNTCSF